MRARVAHYISWAITSVALTSCASMISGSMQDIRLTSTPPGATVTAEPGGYRATTPTELTLRRKEGPYQITFALDGYEPYTVTLTKGTNGWVWGNLIIGGIIGLVVDMSTGAHEKLSPDELHANLIRVGIQPEGRLDDRVYLFASNGGLLVTVVFASD